MQTLHAQDDSTFGGVIRSCTNNPGKILVRFFSYTVRSRCSCFDRVIDDDIVSSRPVSVDSKDVHLIGPPAVVVILPLERYDWKEQYGNSSL